MSQKLFHKLHANISICRPELNCSSKDMTFQMLKLYFLLLNYLVLLSNSYLTTSSLSIQLYCKLIVSVIIITNRIFHGIQYIWLLFAGSRWVYWCNLNLTNLFICMWNDIQFWNVLRTSTYPLTLKQVKGIQFHSCITIRLRNAFFCIIK